MTTLPSEAPSPANRKVTGCIWIVGTAVQDITVEVDIDSLALSDNATSLIRFDDQPALRIPDGQCGPFWIQTRFGQDQYSVIVDLANPQPNDGFYRLIPGDKYELRQSVDKSSSPATQDTVFVPCESLSWGGGGLNVAGFIRAISPHAARVPIKYTDIAMDVGFPTSWLNHFEKTLKQFAALGSVEIQPDDIIGKAPAFMAHFVRTNRYEAETALSSAARNFATYSPALSLEVYLASLAIDTVLYRPTNSRFRRNWVFSRFRRLGKETKDKIILKGPPDPLPLPDQQHFRDLLRDRLSAAGAVVFDSISTEGQFRSAYHAYMDSPPPRPVLIQAMTGSMLSCATAYREDLDKGEAPDSILLFNEKEVHLFADWIERKENSKSAPDKRMQYFQNKDDVPNIKDYAALVQRIRSAYRGKQPRIYVTVGRHGSLATDADGTTVYVGSFTKPNATIFDTNACGDAYAACITLLEWAKHTKQYPRNLLANLVGEGHSNTLCLNLADELRYFMVAASAAAYCKATNRRGVLVAKEMEDVLTSRPIEFAILPRPEEILDDPEQAQCLDRHGRLKAPQQHWIFGVSPGLCDLMRDATNRS